MQQAELFQTEKRKTYGETQQERMHALATSPEVISKMLDVFRAHPGEFISFHQKCRDIWQEYDLGSYINVSLHYIQRLGLLEEKRIYHGSTSPCAAPKTKGKGKQKSLEKPYMGFTTLYRIKEAA